MIEILAAAEALLQRAHRRTRLVGDVAKPRGVGPAKCDHPPRSVQDVQLAPPGPAPGAGVVPHLCMVQFIPRPYQEEIHCADTISTRIWSG